MGKLAKNVKAKGVGSILKKTVGTRLKKKLTLLTLAPFFITNGLADITNIVYLQGTNGVPVPVAVVEDWEREKLMFIYGFQIGIAVAAAWLTVAIILKVMRFKGDFMAGD